MPAGRKSSLSIKIVALFPLIPFIIALMVFSLPKESDPYVMNLAGQWKIQEGDNATWRLSSVDDTAWKKVRFPGYVSQQGYRAPVCWVRKKFVLKPAMEGEDLLLLLGRTHSGFAMVYINGKLTGKIGNFATRTKSEGNTRLSSLSIKKSFLVSGTNQIAIRFHWDRPGYDGINDPRLYLGTEKVLESYYEANMDYSTFFQYGVVFFGLFMLVILGALYVSEGRNGGDRKRYTTIALFLLSAVLYNFFYSGLFVRFSISPNMGAFFVEMSIGFICMTIVGFFLYYFYGKSRRFERINKIICLVYFVLRIIVPDRFVSLLYSLFVYYFFAVIIYTNFMTIRGFLKFKQHRHGHGILIVSSLAIGALAGVFDLLANLSVFFAPSIFNIGISNILIMASLVALLDFIRISSTNKKLTVSLQELNLNLEHKVEERTQDLKEARDALWGEMQLAKKIQTVLLPEEPAIAGYQIAASMMPADEVGGDYYDVVNVNGMDWLVIGDVSGHGVPAGLVMMMVQTAFRVTLDGDPDLAPSELLTVVNKVISHNIKQLGEDKYMTITVFAAYQKGAFTFSGLHQDIMIYRAATKTVEAVETKGMWIGVVDDIQGMVQDDTLSLESDDVMLVYTDGLTEAVKNDVMYGEEQLAEVFASHCEEDAEAIRIGILESLQGYHYSDDITMMILKKE